ncbi:flocculation-associated PEP-CTERM protein PepA [Paucibacter sp. R3-3]|uniref:Flocculation-associated PEP-CTERM protein PepA n=1 Tax=Roseateles agri TaxID=3098619 RepID=A0ABU5DBY2_9BURK|nr:flocculation-associated PEP-CTERM protein PepA [Paucibacter sp. R3-3]MDY0743786.1 flocculation-associated PEP-CTERM protein PepA [Paucibacter sp. R3-3]
MTTTIQRGLIGAGLLALSAAASALPSFTFDPAAVGLNGSSFTADNLLITDYARVTSSPSGAFTETGFLSIYAAQSGDDLAATTGLNVANTGYSLYISFNGTGQITSGSNPLTGPTSGVFNTLDYTLWAAPGKATFTFTNNTPTTSATNAIELASGSLVEGSLGTRVSGSSFSPSADATMTFVVNPASAAFFSSFDYNQALTSFTNTSSQVTVLADGFTINKGGGSINFASAVPEPETYAMMLAGLVSIGFLTRRRGTKR